MAYAAVVTVTQRSPSKYVVRIEETDCSSTDEATLDGLPLVGSVRRQQCILQSGTAATVQPILGEVPDPVTNTDRVVAQEGTAGAITDSAGVATYEDTTPTPPGVVDANGEPVVGARLYHRSRPNAGADNVIVSIYHISTEW